MLATAPPGAAQQGADDHILWYPAEARAWVEALPVGKGAGDAVFAGTLVVKGQGRALVTYTSTGTQLGTHDASANCSGVTGCHTKSMLWRQVWPWWMRLWPSTQPS